MSKKALKQHKVTIFEDGSFSSIPIEPIKRTEVSATVRQYCDTTKLIIEEIYKLTDVTMDDIKDAMKYAYTQVSYTETLIGDTPEQRTEGSIRDKITRRVEQSIDDYRNSIAVFHTTKGRDATVINRIMNYRACNKEYIDRKYIEETHEYIEKLYMKKAQKKTTT